MTNKFSGGWFPAENEQMCLTALIFKVFVLQGRGCAQIVGNFKGLAKLVNFLFFELFEIEKIGFE